MMNEIRKECLDLYGYGLLLDVALFIDEEKQKRRVNVDDNAGAIQRGFLK